MPKTSLDPQEIQQLKKLFIESLNGKDTLITFGRVRLAEGTAVVSRPEGITNYETLITTVNAVAKENSYSVEYWPNSLIIHSSDSADTAEISYMIIGN